jgi:hypothetical protein
MGQAVTGKFSLIAALSLGYDSNRNYRGILTMILLTFQGHMHTRCIFVGRDSAICCGFTNVHRSVPALDLLLLCGSLLIMILRCSSLYTMGIMQRLLFFF